MTMGEVWQEFCDWAEQVLLEARDERRALRCEAALIEDQWEEPCTTTTTTTPGPAPGSGS